MARKYLILLFIEFLARGVFAQQNDGTFPLFIPPQFKGGTKAFHVFLDSNLHYPRKQFINNEQGEVVTTIQIDRNGNINNVVVNGTNEDFNNEVKKIFDYMPDWESGKLNGSPIDTTVIKKIYFSIDNSRKNGDSSIYECLLYKVKFNKENFMNKHGGNIIDFIGGPKDITITMGDSLQKQFFSINQERIERLKNSISTLPIDRCHHGEITLIIDVDSLGKTMNVELLKGASNSKLDSSIIEKAFSLSENWQPIKSDEQKINFKGKITFILLNDYSETRSFRTERENIYYKTITVGQTRKYNHKKYCEDADFYYNRGIEEFKKEDYKRAINNFRETLSINPYDLDALYNLGVSYFKINKLKDACRCFDQAYNYGDKSSEEAILKNCENIKR